MSQPEAEKTFAERTEEFLLEVQAIAATIVPYKAEPPTRWERIVDTVAYPFLIVRYTVAEWWDDLSHDARVQTTLLAGIFAGVVAIGVGVWL